MADYVVFRAGPNLPPGFMPEELDGKWIDASDLPVSHAQVMRGAAVAVPAGRFEVREDGAVAEVWEFQV